MSSKKKNLKKSVDYRKHSRLKRKSLNGSPTRDLIVDKNSIKLVSDLLPVRGNNLEAKPTTNSSIIVTNNMKVNNFGLDTFSKLREERDDTRKDLNFPEEINQQMKNKVELLTRENATLQQRVNELEAQLTALEVKCPPAIHGRASDLAASKIVELSKKIRELTAELEVTKLRARTLENGGKDYLSARTSSDEKKDHDNKRCSEIKELTEKLNSTNLKYYEAKNQVQKLKQDLKNAHKALVNEIGEDCSLQNALSGNGWRGRAQRISALQLKLSQLSEKLSNQQSFQSQSHDALVNVRHAEKEMRSELAKELKECKSELEQTKNKLNASKMRCRVLEGELQSGKEKINSVLNKSNHDDQLIAALTNQITALKEKYNNDITMANTGMEKKYCELEDKLQIERTKSAKLQNIINNRDETILHLQEKNDLFKKNKPREKCDASLMTQTCELGINTAQDLFNQIADAERTRLLELIQVLNKRIEAQRNSLNEVDEELRNERQKRAKLEIKVARLELMRVNNNNDRMYSSKTIIDDNTSWDKSQERIQLLEEQCATLKTRLRCLSQEKEEDVQSLTGLLEQAKMKFMEALKSKSAKDSKIPIPIF